MGHIQFTQCSICAVDITGHSRYDDGPIPWDPSLWPKTAIVLRGPSESFCRYQEIDHLAQPITLQVATASCDHDRELELLPSGETIRPQETRNSEFWNLNVHDTCYMIATKVMQTSPTSRMRSLRDLWVTLDRRCAETLRGSSPSGWDFLPSIPIPRTSREEPRRWTDYYIPDYNPGSYYNWWHDDPFHIPDLTTRLLSNLHHVKPLSAVSQSFQMRVSSLPQELLDKIMPTLREGAIGLECTHLLPQRYWRELFLRIPFLWDLDERVIPGLRDSEGREWDWEKLFRQVMARVEHLTHPEGSDTRAWSHHEVGLDVPPGFTNRRRIWQLLEDMDPTDLEWEATRDPDLLEDFDLIEFERSLRIGGDNFSWDVPAGDSEGWGADGSSSEW